MADRPDRSHPDASAEDAPTSAPERRSGTSPLEWALAAIGALLVGATIAYLLYDALSGSSSPPAIEVTVLDVRPTAGGYFVQFEAENVGETTAAGLEVEGTVRAASGPPETSTVTLDYVPAGAKRRGGLFFTRAPSQDALALRALGYSRP